MRNRDFLADWPGRRDKALKPGLSRLKRDVWYAYPCQQVHRWDRVRALLTYAALLTHPSLDVNKVQDTAAFIKKVIV